VCDLYLRYAFSDMPTEKPWAMVIVRKELGDIYPLKFVMHPFGDPRCNPKHPEHLILLGTIEYMDHHFGPTVRLHKNGKHLDIRIAWSFIVSIVSGADPKKLGFTHSEP